MTSQTAKIASVIAGIVAFIAGLAGIGSFIAQLQSSKGQDMLQATQVARQGLQVSYQETSNALNVEQNRILSAQGTLAAHQAEIMQQQTLTPSNTLVDAPATVTAIAINQHNADATGQALAVESKKIEATQTAIAIAADSLYAQSTAAADLETRPSPKYQAGQTLKVSKKSNLWSEPDVTVADKFSISAGNIVTLVGSPVWGPARLDKSIYGWWCPIEVNGKKFWIIEDNLESS